MNLLYPWFMAVGLGFVVFLIGKALQRQEKQKRIRRKKLEAQAQYGTGLISVYESFLNQKSMRSRLPLQSASAPGIQGGTVSLEQSDPRKVN